MAKAPQRTLVSRLADAGEEAIQKLGGARGADRLLGAMNSMRDRMDDMQKQLRALTSIEKRLTAIERRLDKVEGKGTSARKSSPGSSRKRTSPTRKSSS
jgi:TolA-binding protein